MGKKASRQQEEGSGSGRINESASCWVLKCWNVDSALPCMLEHKATNVKFYLLYTSPFSTYKVPHVKFTRNVFI